VLDRMQLGEVPRKHHIALRSESGALRWEECFTREGFEGPYTILYHERRPHEQTAAPNDRGWTAPADTGTRTLAKRHYQSQALPKKGGAPMDARVPLLFNADVTLSVVHPTTSDDAYFINGDGDDLFFVHEGGGVLRSLLGDVRFEKDDYVFVPKGLLHRFELDGPQYWFSIECHRGVGLPAQWRNAVGQLRMDAPFCHRDFRRPHFTGPIDEGIRAITVKRDNTFHGFRVASSPLDVVGWDGAVYPWAFPILNFQARAGLVHLPPTWHGNFAAGGALICSFVPRIVDFHPESIPCPYPHSSVDIDEVIFYVRGNFTSRKGVGPGSISHHPPGIPHGPHPGAYEKSIGVTRTDELAVMLDCARPLIPTRAAIEIEDAGYHDTFIDRS
jgi:homogentisate 1,2-dioxygenase